jgi:(p)ppGpp synthase/HD superfamily hydrolase
MSQIESTHLVEKAKLLQQSILARSETTRGQDSHELAQQSARVAQILTEWQASVEVQAVALLHNFVYNRLAQLEEVAQQCSRRVAFLCEEYSRLASEQVETAPRGRWRARQRVQHFIAAYCDPELAMLALAVLWERFRCAQSGDPAHAHHFADEARLVVGPFLDMLGIRALREELDVWLWRQQEPAAPLLEKVTMRAFEAIRTQLSPLLPAATILQRQYTLPQTELDAAVKGSSKLASPKLQPVVDVSVLVGDPEACYRALYQIHRLFQPVEGAFFDHMGEPRINGARSLQTAVIVMVGGQRLRANFFICTHEMEEINRWGLGALHLHNRRQIDLPHVWWNTAAEGYAQITSAPVGSLPDTLFVFSPQGQLFRFHRGCTVVDFAYHLHTELADQCQRFYVNDEVAEPNTALHHLDLVALEHDPRAPGPTQLWLNAARTSRARNHIERFLKRRGLGVDHGQKLMDQRRKEMEDYYGFNLPEHRITQATVKSMRELKISRIEDLLAEVATGRFAADRILHPLFAEELIRQIQTPRGSGLRPHQFRLAQCCRPRPGEDIVGYPFRRHGEIMQLRIHRAGCERIQDAEDLLELKWRLQPHLKTIAQLEVTALDEDGLLGEAVSQVYRMLPRVTLHKAEAIAQLGVARLRFNLEAESDEVVDAIADGLRALPNRSIVEVRQTRLPPSELEAASTMDTACGFNPYSRLPVNEQAMFFGRSEELAHIYDWLRSGVGNIWLLGQKRVGKTSLLLHLKNHYLKERGYVPAFVDFQLLGNLSKSNIFFEVANAVYNDLQADPRIGEVGAPLAAMFVHQPPVQLITYLRSLQSRLGASRLVLLLDEFSRTTDAYLHEQVDRSFFDEWRGLLQATAPGIGYITVVQQQTYDSLSKRAQIDLGEPSWHLLELGEKLVLKSLLDQEVRRLIEWPMRNYLEFTPETVASVARLTGGNPFLIQAFCFKLAGHMADQDRRHVEQADIDAVRMEFMQPAESVFAHFLDMIRGMGHQITQQLALLAEARRGNVVGWDEITAALPNLPPDKLRRALRQLTDCDILIQPAPDAWQFASLLFQEWLALHTV